MEGRVVGGGGGGGVVVVAIMFGFLVVHVLICSSWYE